MPAKLVDVDRDRADLEQLALLWYTNEVPILRRERVWGRVREQRDSWSARDGLHLAVADLDRLLHGPWLQHVPRAVLDGAY